MTAVLIKRLLRNNFVNEALENFIAVSCHFQQLFLPNNDRPTYRPSDEKLDYRTKTCPLPTPNFSLLYSTDNRPRLPNYFHFAYPSRLYACVYHVKKSVSLLQSS